MSVEDSAYSVKTVGAEIAGLVSGEQVRELPLNGRNSLQLTLLQPGVTATEGLNSVNKGLLGGADISVSGGSTTSNMWLVDGAEFGQARPERTPVRHEVARGRGADDLRRRGCVPGVEHDGQLTAARDPRTIQLGVRLTF